MKQKLLLLLTLLSPLAAHADLAYQMDNILGDWANNNVVFRIVQQTPTSVRALRCDRDRYYSGSHYCSYDKIFLMDYQSDLDAFYMHQDGYALEEWQVPTQTSSELVVITNPYQVSGRGNFGVAAQYEKVQ